MSPIDIPAIERRARQLRAEEMRRVEGLFFDQLRLLGRLMAGTFLAGALGLVKLLHAPVLRHPGAATVRQEQRPRISLTTRLSRRARSLFAWNPEVHHHV